MNEWLHVETDKYDNVKSNRYMEQYNPQQFKMILTAAREHLSKLSSYKPILTIIKL